MIDMRLMELIPSMLRRTTGKASDSGRTNHVWNSQSNVRLGWPSQRGRSSRQQHVLMFGLLQPCTPVSATQTKISKKNANKNVSESAAEHDTPTAWLRHDRRGHWKGLRNSGLRRYFVYLKSNKEAEQHTLRTVWKACSHNITTIWSSTSPVQCTLDCLPAQCNAHTMQDVMVPDTFSHTVLCCTKCLLSG